MPKNLTSREKRLRAPRGSYEAQRWLAAEEADDTERKASASPRPRLGILYGHVITALDCAVGIMKMVFSTRVPDAIAFVGEQVRLAERLDRIETLLQDGKLLSQWPKSPGVTFSWKAGWSALDVAVQFAQMVHSGVSFTRPDFPAKLDPLQVSPKPDERFVIWKDRAIAEVQDHQVSKHIWPDMGSIHRDYGSLVYKLEDEYAQAIGKIGTKQKQKIRKKIPKSIQTQVFMASRRRCCICYGLCRSDSPVKGQIVHLDRDPSNNELDNLTFMCTRHHEEYDTRSSQTKGFAILEVKGYRKELYRAMANPREHRHRRKVGDTPSS
jgi:hypothetical protein